MFIINFCLNMFRALLWPSSLEQKPSQCSHPTRQRPTTATNRIQQNQISTPNAVTRSLFPWRWVKWYPKRVETEVNNKHLIVASCWFFLSLHTVPDISFLQKDRVNSRILERVNKISLFLSTSTIAVRVLSSNLGVNYRKCSKFTH